MKVNIGDIYRILTVNSEPANIWVLDIDGNYIQFQVLDFFEKEHIGEIHWIRDNTFAISMIRKI